MCVCVFACINLEDIKEKFILNLFFENFSELMRKYIISMGLLIHLHHFHSQDLEAIDVTIEITEC